MAYEDFTTYTEVDEDGDITIIASKISWTNIERNEESYVYKDYGVDYFGDFDHDFEMQINTSDNNAIAANWVMSNEIDDFSHTIDNNLPGLCVRTSRDGSGVYNCVIYNMGNGVVDVGIISANTLYYCTATRVGTTFTLYIYSNSARSVLVDTLTVVCTNTALRYLYGMSTKNDGASEGYKHNGFSQNFDLKEPLPPEELSDSLSISDSIVFKHTLNLSETLTINDNMLSFIKIIVALSDSVNIDDTIAFKHTLNLTDTIGISDIIAFKHLITLADNLGISDAAVFKHIMSLSDSVNISDVAAFKHVVALLDSLSISDVIAFKHILNLSDDVNISDAVIYKHLVALADSLGISDDPVFKHLIALIDAMNISDSTLFKHTVHLFDSILISDATVISGILADILSIADSMTFRMTSVCGALFNLHSATHDVYLPMPDVAGEIGSIKNEIKLFDFWTDERDTVNIGIDSEPIVFSGIIYACTDNEEAEMTAIATSFLHIHDISNTHEEVTITGLGDNFDAVYVIKDFKYATIRKSPYAYTWQLTLGYVRAI